MKRFLSIGLLSCALALPAMAALKAGDAAPEFNAQASFAGKATEYSLKDALKKGPVVVYFYPSAYTSGCNVQANAFAVNNEKFAAAGASIIGVNNRNLRTLQVDVQASEALIARMPADVIAVSESGLKTAADIARLKALGYRAFLIGERFMTMPDPGAALSELLRAAVA